MGKVRIYKLASKLNITSKELIRKLLEKGIKAENHMSSVEEKEALDVLKDKIPEEKKKEVKKGESPSKVDQPPAEKTSVEETEVEVPEKEPGNALKVPEGVTVKDYAELVNMSSSEIIKQLMQLGELLTINQSMSPEAITILSESLGYEAHLVSPFDEVEEEQEEIFEEDLEPRPPVVTIMGHVDHGKTTLLDAIRKTEVAGKEAGGITQHIGAYQIIHNKKRITCIDTPGHEAFTSMRARGAKITDIAVLVVAADDGVMPQTVEAIDHAKVAKVPILIAVNKIDKPGANPERIRTQLSDYELVPEDWGGDTIYVDVSAKQGTNLDELLEMILLLAEVQEMKATKKTPARGVVVEARLDKGRGPLATVLIKKGILRPGQAILAGTSYGKTRALNDDKGNPITEAYPAQPVEVIRLSSVPEAGSEFVVVSDDRTARKIAEERALKKRLIEKAKPARMSLEDLFAKTKEGEIPELKLVIKGDVQGTIEAIEDVFKKLPQEKVKISIIHTGVGAVTEADVMLAIASDAVLIGFNVRPDLKTKRMAAKENIEIRTYRVIYQLIEDIEASMKGMLAPEYVEEVLGRAEVRDTFKVSRLGVIAGCSVIDGIVTNDSSVRLIREGSIVFEGKLESLRRFKDDVKEVKSGFECGIRLQDFSDIKVGDEMEFYKLVVKEPE